jgi:hypothetical protein
MIHTEEDDEFERIERENSMKGQPYHGETDAIKAAVLIEREACARECERMMLYPNAKQKSAVHQNVWEAANAIRARN